MAIATLLLVALTLAVIAYRSGARASAPLREMRLDVVLPLDVFPRDVALSPDGTQIVAARPGHLWLRPLGSEAGHAIAGTEGVNAGLPFWSPDGQSVAFFDVPSQLKRIDLATGLIRSLATAPQAVGGSWGSTGTILFVPSLASPVIRVGEAGGATSPATRLATGQQGHRFPQFLPDGRHFVYVAVGTPETRGLYIASLDDPDNARRLMDTESGVVVAPPDTLLFMRQGALMAQRLDVESLRLTGDPEPVARQVVAISNQFNALLASASANGSLVYRRDLGARQLTWFDRSGRQLEVVGEPDDGQQAGFNQSSGRISRDGRRLALQRTVNGNADIWLVDLSRGSQTRLTIDEVRDASAVWSPDGTRLVFGSERNGVYDMYEKPADGSPSEVLVLASAQHKMPEDWSSDGGFIVYNSQDARGRDLWALPMTGERKPIPIATSRFEEWNARFSPDGRWIAYQSDESGRPQIYLQPFPGPGRRVQVSSTRGVVPRWRQDGRELFFLGTDDQLMSVSVSLTDATVQVGTPAVLFAVPDGSSFLPSPDGQRFLVSTLIRDPAPLTLLLNWARTRK